MLELSHEALLEVMAYLPTRELCRFMVISKYFNQRIREIIVDRFSEVFSNQRKRLLVYMSRYDLLELSETRYVFDFTFKSLSGETLISTFFVDSTQPKGTIGPKHVNLEGLILCGGGIWKQRPVNNSIQYLGWGVDSEEKEARIYIYDCHSRSPYTKACYVTHGRLITPVDGCISTKGWWSAPLRSKNKRLTSTAGFVGRNKASDKVSGIPYVMGKLKTITIKAELLLVACEEQHVDKSKGGVKYLLMEGGEECLRQKKNCVIC
ncbi:5775_t:CDS:2 [Acaulospora morrowiae]|uniref:5775_t:CDS:1 n=1 Tax=Acaulospora morrowiae TaxID=94023 RepID=A0A9N9G361_9GLOM|nr:5775_t:CDS:2 [Acaulospora morrowiae]